MKHPPLAVTGVVKSTRAISQCIGPIVVGTELILLSPAQFRVICLILAKQYKLSPGAAGVHAGKGIGSEIILLHHAPHTACALRGYK